MAAATANNGWEKEDRGNGLRLARTKESFSAFVKREFAHHEEGIARINNGSFGSCPQSVLVSQELLFRAWLRQPDKFYFQSLEDGILESRRAVAALVNAPGPEQIFLLENVTVGVSLVLQRISWDFIEGRFVKGDAVLAFNFAYGAVKKALKAYLVRAGAHLIEVKLPFPVSCSDEILCAFNDALKKAERESHRIRFAVIDHITSIPSIVLPVKELVSMCRQAGVDQILVDGAHAIGSIDIDLQEIDSDYYISNLHKWLFAPPAVAFMYCKTQHLSALHHPIVSHNYQNGLASECAWVGTRDYSAHLAVNAAIKFFDEFEGGIQAVKRYNHEQVVSMGAMLAQAWGTHCGTPPELCGSMIMVGLPNELNVNSPDDALDLRARLRGDFGIEVPVYYAQEMFSESSENGPRCSSFSAYVRVSYQIYNTLRDYLRFRDAITCLAFNASE